MCFSEVYGFHDKAFSRWLCFMSLIYSLVLAIQAWYAHHSRASSEHWQLYVDHFKPQEINFYTTLSICCAISGAATVTNTYVRRRLVLCLTGAVLCMCVGVSVVSFITCITSGPSHVVKSFMLFSFMWPFLVMVCIFLNMFYLDDILSSNYVDWQYLTDTFTINLRVPRPFKK